MRLAAPALLGAGVVAVAALISSATPASACACGIAVDATVQEESALVVERPDGEQIVLSLDLASDGAGRAAVVLPVPGEPSVTAVRGGDPLAYLDRATAPPPMLGGDSGAGAEDGATAGASAVDVIGRETIGGYDVARLGASDAAALDAWLDDNGYVLPDGAEPILDEYVSEDWRFVAIKLARDSDGWLKPLAVSFDTDQPVYPMRLEQLATDPLDLTLYTLADGPRTVTGLDQVWTGSVAELSPPPPDSMSDLFDDGGFVTRLEARSAPPSAYTSDLVIDQSVEVDAEEDVASVPAGGAVGGVDPEGGISTGGVVAIVAAGLVFAIGLFLILRGRPG